MAGNSEMLPRWGEAPHFSRKKSKRVRLGEMIAFSYLLNDIVETFPLARAASSLNVHPRSIRAWRKRTA
jgi:hypothetical protein